MEQVKDIKNSINGGVMIVCSQVWFVGSILADKLWMSVLMIAMGALWMFWGRIDG